MNISTQIENLLKEVFNPQYLEVINQSHLHAGHAGDDGSGESHFKLVIVSGKFAGLTRIERHRLVYSTLEKRLENLPHAIAISAFTPEEQFRR